MLERLLKYWPVITVAALTVVSVFNIGYFSSLGLHFIGVMDLSNVIYAVGLVFGFLIAPVVMFPDNLSFKEIAASPKAMLRVHNSMKYIIGVVSLCFAVGLFIHRPYVTIITLFAITFTASFVVSVAYGYLIYLHTETFALRSAVAVVGFALFTISWIGGAVGYHEAFETKTLYLVTTKDAVYDKVRLARSSSSGFLITQDKRVIYIPSGEMKSIASIEPVDKNP